MFYDEEWGETYHKNRKIKFGLSELRKVTLLISNDKTVGLSGSLDDTIIIQGKYRLYFYFKDGKQLIVENKRKYVNFTDFNDFLTFCRHRGIKVEKGQGYE